MIALGQHGRLNVQIEARRKCAFVAAFVLAVSLLLVEARTSHAVKFADIEPTVTKLEARVRSGQIFLTWNESPVPKGVTFNVFKSDHPITMANLGQAMRVGHHIEAGSACDWWQDPASFTAGAEPDRTHGFLIDGEELKPTGGLFVHTVVEDVPLYFAVQPSNANASEFVPGKNSLLAPVRAVRTLPQPIAQGKVPERGTGNGKSLTLVLHGRGGGTSKSKANFLVFGDGKQGWREGLARKFSVQTRPEGIVITPLDRIWIGRPLLFSWDSRDHVPAIGTWWYGCNQFIYDVEEVNRGVVVNYTEEHLLYLVRWAQQYYGTDPAKTYIRGSSMGGSGAISMAFRHPQVFATVHAGVPIVAYTSRAGRDGKSSLKRLDGLCGRECDETVMSSDGISVIERMNSERIVRQSMNELPFLVLYQGRNDGSIPWVNNPSFYRALNASKRGFACYWNDGAHDMGKSTPEDIHDYLLMRPKLSFGSSYPAFSNCSANRNPGNGEKDDGDIEGWMNRGLYWSEVSESENTWRVQLRAKGDFLPPMLRVDVTPRRLSRFHIAPSEILLVNGKRLRADENGLLTIRNIELQRDDNLILEVKRIR